MIIVIILLIVNVVFLFLGFALVILDIFDSFGKNDKDREGKLPRNGTRGMLYLLLSFLILVLVSIINLAGKI